MVDCFADCILNCLCLCWDSHERHKDLSLRDQGIANTERIVRPTSISVKPEKNPIVISTQTEDIIILSLDK